ncbi:hypothetical protein B0J12DRAFT_651015 [Macrophomina phaseolina]|uniref:Acetoacetate decarboxylase n=1 Tax=Macrophomina phaseolina TaxID=35725 RepID=A0ABQ8GJR2_9PEZI|nr:hypothetical protein B0J12DRAFT_651015 [Macrophomina phaseolina]
MPFGKLSVEANAVPAFAPPYLNKTHEFSDITVVSISYRVTRASVEKLVPDVLELEEEPLVSCVFLDYGMSTVGSYKEFVQQVEVTYQGTKYNHPLVLILDNEAAIFAGREVFGYPKVFGKTVIEASTGSRPILGRAERPLGREMVAFEFLPEQRIAAGTLPPPPVQQSLNLRVIPASVPGGPPAVREFVPVSMEFEMKDVWLGQGHISFPRTSALDPWANVEILRYESAFYTTGASAVLRDPTKTYPF